MVKQLLGTTEDFKHGLFTIEVSLPFMVGQLVMLNMYDLTDNYFFSKERIQSENLTKEDVNEKIEQSKICIPGLITSITLDKDIVPLANVIIFSRWNSGEISGGIEVSNVYIWKYINYDVPISSWLLESIKLTIEKRNVNSATYFDIPVSKIFYIKREDDKYYAVYPFIEQS